MNFKQAITESMTALAVDKRTRFVGYGMQKGRAMGTLSGVSSDQIIETTVAENHMVAMATGLSLAGLLPLVYVERCDFLIHAADAIVNHLDKIETISRGQFKPAVIIRITVGNSKKPLFTGVTHTRDHSEAFRLMCPNCHVATLSDADQVLRQFAEARQRQLAGESTLLFEYKDLI